MTELATSVIEGVAKGSSDLLKDLVKGFASGLTSMGRTELARLSVDFEACFRAFLDRNAKRLSKTKTLLRPDTPISLESTFVSPNLTISEKTHSEDRFLRLLETEKSFAIKGIGGSGKSVLLKHLFLRYYNEPLGRVPFFIELRDVPQDTGGLKVHLLNQLAALNESVTSPLFEYALKQGKFVFLLDGFDEVAPSYQVSLANQIKDLIYKYNENSIIVSSRPDNILDSISEIYSAHIQPFSKQQVISLISKLRYDKSIKSEFKRIVDQHLFETHKAYLSNPLLCTIMLMTFTRGAEIPSKLHLFFQKAYEVLSYQHDSMKGIVYRRKYHTSMAEDEFKEVFSAFSFIAYTSAGSSFKVEQALEFCVKALGYCQKEADPNKLLKDLCVSISILIREGDHFNYIHRSFQEYFAAMFIAKQRFDRWDTVIESILTERSNDSVPQLIFEMDQGRFETEFLAQRLNNLCRTLATINIEESPAAAFRLFYLAFGGSANKVSSFLIGSTGVKRPKWTYMLSILHYYPDRSYSAALIREDFNWVSHLQSFGIHLDIRGTEFDLLEPDHISDDIFLGTPMVVYLNAIKDRFHLLSEKINADSISRQNLLTGVTARLIEVKKLNKAARM